MGRQGLCHGQGNGWPLSLFHKCAHAAPRGLGTKLRMPDRYYGLSVHPHPTAIQDPTGRREGRVGRKCWALDPEKGRGWAERICFQA